MSTQNPRQVDEYFAKSFNAGDVDAIMALYEPGATLFPRPGSPVTGHAGIREALTQLMSLGAQIDLRTRSAVESAGLTLMVSDWSLTGGTDPNGDPVELSGRATVVLRRQSDGAWLMVIDNPWSNAD